MLTYDFNECYSEPKYLFLYRKIKEDIQLGVLKTKERLPSKRSLAEHLGVGLITVENAYQLLKEEGYIETRERSGYFVAKVPNMGPSDPVSKEQLNWLETENSNRNTTSSQGGRFPSSLYFKTIRRVISEYGEELLWSSPNQGCGILRNSIAAYLQRYRGIFAQPKQIIIGSGAEYLYGTVVRLFGADYIYGIEDPSYAQIETVYRGNGASCEKLRMGTEGILTEALQNTSADILHVTPFHSYPSGVTAPVGKRMEYLEWAKKQHKGRKRFIVEDDFDSEFFMPGKPIQTLFMMDQGHSVIYINTFSKSLSPSIRMGYMILPEKLLDRYEKTSGAYSCTVPVLEQYALAEFINKGYFEQHLNRIRRMNKKIKK